MGLGSFHMRNYPTPYRIVFIVNAPNSNTFCRTNPSESTNPTHYNALFIHDDLLVENSVSSVKIHNPTLI